MADFFTIENALNLMVLIFLQAVLGFDNLLYISIESKRAPQASQAAVRRWGILIAIGLRIVLLFTMIQLLDALKDPFFAIDVPGIIKGEFNFASIVFLPKNNIKKFKDTINTDLDEGVRDNNKGFLTVNLNSDVWWHCNVWKV